LFPHLLFCLRPHHHPPPTRLHRKNSISQGLFTAAIHDYEHFVLTITCFLL
jgi:hypothetical protein